jgi:hypothetical protein
MEKERTRTQKAVDEAQYIMESFDPSPAMTLGFDEPEYTVTAEQMIKIASALYLASCELEYQNNNNIN